MEKFILILALSLILSISFGFDVFAQTPTVYGLSINLETANKIAASAIAEARKNNWAMAVAITDVGGDLIYFEKIDGTMTGNVKVALNKARSAALFKRPTKVWQDLLAAGGNGLPVLGLEGAVPIEGGLPLLTTEAKSLAPSSLRGAQHSRTV